MSHVREGRSGTAELLVTPQDSALALGSGDVAVLATPRLIALLEEATCAALDGTLDAHQTSVGVHVDVHHRRPTPMGAHVWGHARIVSVEDSRVVFDVHADHEDAQGQIVERIARGRITRAIVDREAFGSQIPVVERG